MNNFNFLDGQYGAQVNNLLLLQQAALFVEAGGQAVEAEGQAVEAEGQAVEAEGQAVEAEGQAVEAEGQAVEAEGQAVEAEGQAVEAQVPQPAPAEFHCIYCNEVFGRAYTLRMHMNIQRIRASRLYDSYDSPPVHPSTDGGALRSRDELTFKSDAIIKASANVRKCDEEGAPVHVISESEQLLQFHVAIYMDNDIAGIPQAPQKSG
ncbi:RPO21_2 [Sanghuangporus vaninii]